MSRKAGEWLEEQYLKWQLRNGTRKTISEFAEYMGVSQSFVSQVIGGKREPSASLALDWALITGDYEILDIMDVPRDDAENEKRARELRARYDAVPPEHVQEFFRLVDQFLEERGWRRSGDIRPANHDKQE